jgi:N-acetylneuraminic acid mutarotase
MISCRKEHSCVYMNGLVYALSGYDSKNKCMAGCEVYDINKDEWRSIASLNVPRCAFAVSMARNRIWVMGGFNGS